MNTTTIKDDIVQLLEAIVNRSHRINQHHPVKDLLIEIDLAQDDLRMLYRRLEMLKEFSLEEEQQNAMNLPVADAEVTTDEGVKTPPVSHETEVRESEHPDLVEEQKMAEKEDYSVSSDPAAQTPAAGEQEKSVEEQKSEAADQIKEEEMPEKEDLEGPPVQEKEEIPQADQHMSVPEPPPPPQPVEKEKSNNGNKALIDILAQYRNTTIGDQYLQEDDNSLHKRIASNKEDRSIGTRMQQQPINNLKEVIGVNEKFLFINELFNGNIQEYHQAIANLNEMEDIRTAFDYLNKLGMEHSWDAGRSATTIEKLANYVQRRHMHK